MFSRGEILNSLKMANQVFPELGDPIFQIENGSLPSDSSISISGSEEIASEKDVSSSTGEDRISYGRPIS